MPRLLRLLLIACLIVPVIARAQQRPVTAAALREVRIRFTDEWARVAESGVLSFPRQGLMARATVVGIDTAGKPMSVGRFAPRWSTSDRNVVSTYGNPSDNPVGAAMGIVAQEAGRAAITVTVAGKTATLPVIVGKPRLEIAASELTPKFRAARLEVIADVGNAGPEAEGSSSGIRLRENGHGVLLRPKATAADGTVIPVEHFPVTWTTSDEKIVELYQTTDTTTQTTAHAVGSATITATLQGISVTVPVEVVKMGTTVGPMRGPQVVGSATGGASGLPVEKGEIATSSSASTAAPTTTSPTLRTVDSTSRSGGILTTAPTTTAPTATAVTGPVIVSGTVEPLVVQATGFRATAGPAYNQLFWNPAPGAFGYRVTRYDNTSQQRVTMKGVAGDTIFPENALTDKAVTAGVTYGYRLLTYFKRSDGSLVATPDTGQGVLSTPKDPNAVPELPAGFLGPMDVQAAIEQQPANASGLTDVLAIRWNWHAGAAAYEVLRRTSVGTEWYNDAGGLVPGILFLSPRLSNTSVYQYCVRALSPEHPVTKKRIGSAPTYVRVDIVDRTKTPPTRKITITKGSATNVMEGAWLDCPGPWRMEARSW